METMTPGRGGLFQGAKNKLSWEPAYGGGKQGWEALQVTSQEIAECSGAQSLDAGASKNGVRHEWRIALWSLHWTSAVWDA